MGDCACQGRCVTLARIIPNRIRLVEREIVLGLTPVEISPENPARKSIVVQNVSASANLVAWVGSRALQSAEDQDTKGAGYRIDRYESTPIYEHHDPVYARAHSTDPVTIRVQEELYVDATC